MKDYDIGKAFDRVEHEIMASMVRNMKRHRLEEITEGKEWTMWQAEQLKALERFKRENRKKYRGTFKDINDSIRTIILQAKTEGGMGQERYILENIKKGVMPKGLKKSTSTMGEFFKLNERKLEALIHATSSDMEKAEHAVFRMADDQYRKIIFDAQVYANTGAGTYEKAIDMATKDFLSHGINCIQYTNGARHSISDYADMAIRTAAKRAYLQGEGEIRQIWGISTVILKKRGNACPKCLPFVGKVLIDDVWSGGTARDGPYPLMSEAIAAGLYHPRCKDIHTTYFEGISAPPNENFSETEVDKIKEDYKREQKQKYAQRQAEKFERLAEFSLDEENRRKYKKKSVIWEKLINFYDRINEHIPIGLNQIEKKHKDAIYNLLDNSDYRIKQLTFKYIDDIKFVNEKTLGKGLTSKNGIRVNLKKDFENKRGMYTTTFHEMGHCIDRAGGGLSYKTEDFRNALINDFDNVVKAYQKEYNVDKLETYHFMSEKLLTDSRHSISDIVGGITNNQCVGKYLHDANYWNKPHKLEKEAFAHYYEAFARNDTEKIMYLSGMFPEATKEFIRIIGE